MSESTRHSHPSLVTVWRAGVVLYKMLQEDPGLPEQNYPHMQKINVLFLLLFLSRQIPFKSDMLFCVFKLNMYVITLTN